MDEKAIRDAMYIYEPGCPCGAPVGEGHSEVVKKKVIGQIKSERLGD